MKYETPRFEIVADYDDLIRTSLIEGEDGGHIDEF